METLSNLHERIGHVDRPYSIEDLKQLRRTKNVSTFLKDARGYHDDYYDEDVPSKYPDLASEFNLDNVTVGDLCDAFDRMIEYYDTLSDYQPIYRLVSDYRGSDYIDAQDAGHCWARSLSGLRHYIYNSNSYGGNETSRLSAGNKKRWKFFIGETHIDNIDWIAEAFLDIWGWTSDSDENELRIWDTSKVRILKVLDLSNTEVNSLLHGDEDLAIDWKNLDFTEDKSTGETMTFEEFKKLIEDNPKRLISSVLFPLWQNKEVDVEWFDDFIDEKELPIGYGIFDAEGYNTVVNRVFHNNNYTKEDYQRTSQAAQRVVEIGERMSNPDEVNWAATLLTYCVDKGEIIKK